MSYSRDLDELPEHELHDELDRRARLRAEGKCDYCGRRAGVLPPCRFPGRHWAQGRRDRRRQMGGVKRRRTGDE